MADFAKRDRKIAARISLIERASKSFDAGASARVLDHLPRLGSLARGNFASIYPELPRARTVWQF